MNEERTRQTKSGERGEGKCDCKLINDSTSGSASE